MSLGEDFGTLGRSLHPFGRAYREIGHFVGGPGAQVDLEWGPFLCFSLIHKVAKRVFLRNILPRRFQVFKWKVFALSGRS